LVEDEIQQVNVAPNRIRRQFELGAESCGDIGIKFLYIVKVLTSINISLIWTIIILQH
jgi:hypothetical protein